MKDRQRVEVRPSKVGGLGVFAAMSFVSGTLVRTCTIEREVTIAEPLRPDEDPDHTFLANGKVFLAGVPDRYLNHSCDPSTYLRFVGNEIELVARRNVEPGDELSLDYLINNGGGSSWPCKCGSTRCRGLTGSSFFSLPESFQREYFPLLADWFSQQYSSQLRALREQLGI